MRAAEDGVGLFIELVHGRYPVAFDGQLARKTGRPMLEHAARGRIALVLAEKGLDITGVDVSHVWVRLFEPISTTSNQVRRDLWRHTEIGPNGEVRAEDTREMALRWTYRWELCYLLTLCGLAVGGVQVF